MVSKSYLKAALCFLLFIGNATSSSTPANITAEFNKNSGAVDVTWKLPNPSASVSFFKIFCKLLVLDGTAVENKESYISADGRLRQASISGLEMHSTFEISVQSFTSENETYSNRSTPVTVYTPSKVSDPPRNLHLEVIAHNRIRLKWMRPEYFWGDFYGYEVLLAEQGQKGRLYKPCNYTQIPECSVDGLFSYTNYVLTVRAMTEFGEGRYIQNSTKTVPRVGAITDTTASIYIVSVPNATYYQVISYKLESLQLPTLSPSSIDENMLQPYARANSSFYIATVITSVQVTGTKQFLLGDGSETTWNSQAYVNVPLKASSYYAFFQRTVKSDGTIASLDWMGPVKTLPATPTETEDDLTENEIAIITVGCAIAFVTIIFVIICCCVYKYSLKYAPSAPTKRPKQKKPLDSAIPVTERDFYDHTTQMKFNNFKGFYDEFSSLKNEFQASEVSNKSSNIHKSRNLHIPCYDNTRVLLEDSEYDFIHANFVQGYRGGRDYIATQAPMPNTVLDFWTMIWENDVNKIIMLNNVHEKGQKICEKYWPTQSTPMLSYGVIRLISTKETADYAIRTFSLSRPGKETRDVTQFHFKSWPEIENTPKYPTPFLEFYKATQTVPSKPGTPVVVHCVNGTGRSGIFIAVDSQVKRVTSQHDINIFDQVETIRSCRYEGIKTLDEYIFIHDVILEYLLLRDIKSTNVNNLPVYIDDSRKRSRADVMQSEYDLLKLTVIAAANRSEVANQAFNTSKNRFETSLPYDDNRVVLAKTSNIKGSDYINASFIDTFLKKKSFITTQSPLEATIGDFWRMIWEHQAWVVVMLGQEIEDGRLRSEQYWPDEGYVFKVGDYSVAQMTAPNARRNGEIIVRQLKLEHNETGESRLVQHYQYLNWPSYDDMTSEGIGSLVLLTHETDSWREQLKAKHVVVHSSSGIGRTGVLIALQSIKEEASMEGSINVFRTVHRLRQQRSGLIQTMYQYRLIYSAALEITKKARRQKLGESSIVKEELMSNNSTATSDSDDSSSKKRSLSPQNSVSPSRSSRISYARSQSVPLCSSASSHSSETGSKKSSASRRKSSLKFHHHLDYDRLNEVHANSGFDEDGNTSNTRF